jgi:hypothetical protein
MPIYRPRRKDVKYYVEEGMRNLGYKAHSNYVEKLGEAECSVVFADFDNNIDTQESYWDYVWLKIIFSVLDNNEVPYKIVEILRYVTKFVEDSGAPNCTSFEFGNIHCPQGGTATEVEMRCCYKFEADWVDPSSEHS